jgi:hypothetical protein
MCDYRYFIMATFCQGALVHGTFVLLLFQIITLIFNRALQRSTFVISQSKQSYLFKKEVLMYRVFYYKNSL